MMYQIMLYSLNILLFYLSIVLNSSGKKVLRDVESSEFVHVITNYKIKYLGVSFPPRTLQILLYYLLSLKIAGESWG